jgi:hypothetical protein
MFTMRMTKIGAVQRVMIDKISGKLVYAVISFGGFSASAKIITLCRGLT